MKKWFVMVLMMIGTAFCQDDYYWKSNVPFAKKPKMSNEDLKQHREEYLKKAITLKSKNGKYSSDPFMSKDLYDDKICITNLDSLEDNGFETIKAYSTFGPQTNYDISIIKSDIIVEGTITKIDYHESDILGLTAFYTFKIDKVLNDKGYLDNDIKSIILATYSGNNIQTSADNVSGFNLGQKILAFAFLPVKYYKHGYDTSYRNHVFMLNNAFEISSDRIFNLSSRSEINLEEYSTILKMINKFKKLNNESLFFESEFK